MSSLRPNRPTDEDAAELKACHLACSLLVKGCQSAIFEFRETAAAAGGGRQALAARRTIEILEEILECWCDTLAVFRASLNQTSAQSETAGQQLEMYDGVFSSELPGGGWTTAKAPGQEARN